MLFIYVYCYCWVEQDGVYDMLRVFADSFDLSTVWGEEIV